MVPGATCSRPSLSSKDTDFPAGADVKYACWALPCLWVPHGVHCCWCLFWSMYISIQEELLSSRDMGHSETLGFLGSHIKLSVNKVTSRPLSLGQKAEPVPRWPWPGSLSPFIQCPRKPASQGTLHPTPHSWLPTSGIWFSVILPGWFWYCLFWKPWLQVCFPVACT